MYLLVFYLIDDAVNNPGSDIEKDTARMTILPPARIFLPTDCPVVQISCGLHHTGKIKFYGFNYMMILWCKFILLSATSKQWESYYFWQQL